MQEINIKLSGENNKEEDFLVYAYILKELFDNVKNTEEMETIIEEYNLNLQNKKFNPMQHIINQHARYLNMSLDFNLKDKW